MKIRKNIMQSGQTRLQYAWHSQDGQVSRAILVMAGAVLVIAVIVFIAISIVNSKKPANTPPQDTTTNNEPPKPIYDATVGDIYFKILSSLDMGNILVDARPQYTITTTDRFIKVAISAQNKGKMAIGMGSWDLGNIIDSDGRVYVSITAKAYNFLPKPDLCGASMKPEFTPTTCVRIYEVSKASRGMKVEIINKTAGGAPALLDLKLP